MSGELNFPQVEHGHKHGKHFPVPAEAADRTAMRERAALHLAEIGLVPPLLLEELETQADALLAAEKYDPKYREFLMVLLNNAAWQPIIATIPYERRTLLLPPCMRNSQSCRAQFDKIGLLCEHCGGCHICGLSEEAEDLGYTVLVAEGTSVVGKLIEDGKVDAVIGVSCMEALERSFPRATANAIAGLAVPLLCNGCKDTPADVSWVREAIRMKSPRGWAQPLDTAAVHKEVASWFDEHDLRARLKAGNSETENIALHWLAKSGKRWRPFLTACVYRALAGTPNGPWPAAVRDVSIAIECIHKASLIYDDVQDDDGCRYGEETVHTQHGIPVALTASLLLLGYGYRLIADCAATPPQRAEMLRLATDGHCQLCLGQGSELLWTKRPSQLSREQVIEFFRTKTAPSFEVVLRVGAVLANADEATHAALCAYSEAIGIGYQIQDDMQDFTETGDVDDIRKHRPSIMLALAHEHATPAEREIVSAAWTRDVDLATANQIREIIARHDIAGKAATLLRDYRQTAYRALSPLRNSDVKMVLYRVAAKILNVAANC